MRGARSPLRASVRWFAGLLCVVGIGAANTSLPGLEILGTLQGPVRAERIIDGDTFVLDGGERVRIIGVDAPEVGEPYADDATALLEALIWDRDLYLEFDVGERDIYGRLLAYVYVLDPDGAWQDDDGHRYTQASHALALAGLAYVMTIPPNVAYAEVYVEATRSARDAVLGVWEVWACADLNTSSRERLKDIVHIGAARVDAVLANRPYSQLTDLLRVDGIGAARLADIADQGIVCPLD
jgi:endonuclease YncB( thermonuclease family)